MEKKLYDLKEFATTFNFTDSRSRDIAKYGVGVYSTKFGNRWYVDIDKFNKYTDQCINNGTPFFEGIK